MHELNFRWSSFALLVILVIGVGCGGSGSSSTPPPTSTSPAISSVAPSTGTAGMAAFTLTVNGSTFVSGSTVQWNGTARTTTYVSASQLTASITAADVATAGTASVVVANPDGTKSSAANFTITASAPLIASLLPTSATAAGAPFTLTVNGSGFLSGATVQWNGSSRTTTFVSASQVTAAISTADLAVPGTVPVVVSNPDGSKSPALSFTISPASPATLGSLAPNTADAGGAGLTLTVTGAGFLPGAVVTWNGSNRPTTYSSATQISAQLAASDLTSAGSATVAVVQAGVPSSNQLPFTTIAFSLSSLAPANAQALGAAFTLTVNGSGFFSDSTVQWNGSNRATNFVSATKLTAAITAADIATAGSASVKVITPSSGNASSNALAFTITPVGTIQQLASINTAGVEGANASFRAVASSDGRYVSFPSLAPDLIATDTNASPDVFVRDTCLGAAPTGCTPSTNRVSVDNSNNELVTGIDGITAPMSVNGRYFAYPTRTFLQDVIRDTCIGVASGCTTSTTSASVPNGGGAAVMVDSPIAISPDGRYVGFTSPSITVVSGVTVPHQAYVRDTCMGVTGSCTPTTMHVSIGNSGSASIPPSGGYIGAISRGGRYVLFSALDTNVLPGLALGATHIFMRDTCTGVSSGCTPTTTLIDIGTDGTEGNYTLNTDAAGDNPGTFSDDARYVLFNSQATNLVSGTLFHILGGIPSRHVQRSAFGLYSVDDDDLHARGWRDQRIVKLRGFPELEFEWTVCDIHLFYPRCHRRKGLRKGHVHRRNWVYTDNGSSPRSERDRRPTTRICLSFHQRRWPLRCVYAHQPKRGSSSSAAGLCGEDRVLSPYLELSITSYRHFHGGYRWSIVEVLSAARAARLPALGGYSARISSSAAIASSA